RREAGLRQWGQTCGSVFARERTAPAKPVVHTNLDGVLVVPEFGADDVGGAGGESGVAEVVILVLSLGRPVRREHVFQTAADGIAVLLVAAGGEGGRQAGNGDADIVVAAPGVTAFGVEQRRTPSVAQPAGYRTE